MSYLFTDEGARQSDNGPEENAAAQDDLSVEAVAQPPSRSFMWLSAAGLDMSAGKALSFGGIYNIAKCHFDPFTVDEDWSCSQLRVRVTHLAAAQGPLARRPVISGGRADLRPSWCSDRSAELRWRRAPRREGARKEREPAGAHRGRDCSLWRRKQGVGGNRKPPNLAFTPKLPVLAYPLSRPTVQTPSIPQAGVRKRSPGDQGPGGV
ncbi:hypothetical protein EYF80_025032 [Liparis tanakae]|uniref:Uncharacterized protein n=1 Tax=Liparis tanakae TaxID=230148 RepID=A0A4Z2HG71_9TELE|nr:hypothetical protein EYF80_025032 [Liparis tanakae]